ncbi:hypothetical protein G7Y89_g7059 [Cudoniella acicularis]|uniref:Transposase n=1 Tax=Cudoniella acicularis TaxID=354080 RepID=A0A8H4W4X5_9HELO|nr:hypothetical protein G7Y89_g7059 [Cudoniella acicularis]
MVCAFIGDKGMKPRPHKTLWGASIAWLPSAPVPEFQSFHSIHVDYRERLFGNSGKTLHEEGYSPTDIWHKTNIPRTTVSSFIKRQTACPNPAFENKPKSSRPRKITPRGERALLYTKTVAKVLKLHGRAKRRTRKKPFLSPLHKEKRRIHCKAEEAMKRDNRNVCWSDEVTFELGEDLQTFWVTRGPGREEEYADKNLRPTFKSGRTTPLAEEVLTAYSCCLELGQWLPHPDEIVFIYENTREESPLREMVTEVVANSFLVTSWDRFSNKKEDWSKVSSAHPLFLVDVMESIKKHTKLSICELRECTMHLLRNQKEERFIKSNRSGVPRRY